MNTFSLPLNSDERTEVGQLRAELRELRTEVGQLRAEFNLLRYILAAFPQNIPRAEVEEGLSKSWPT